jgi:hypothetical protein
MSKGYKILCGGCGRPMTIDVADVAAFEAWAKKHSRAQVYPAEEVAVWRCEACPMLIFAIEMPTEKEARHDVPV